MNGYRQQDGASYRLPPGMRAMKWVWVISAVMTITGLAMTITGQLLELTSVVSVAGMLFVVAGVVKLIIAGIWSGMFQEQAAGDQLMTNGTEQ